METYSTHIGGFPDPHNTLIPLIDQNGTLLITSVADLPCCAFADITNSKPRTIVPVVAIAED